MTIEQRAIHDWGITNCPELAAWMTKDGILINGSYEGWQRDRDHREISQYFKRSKFEDPGSSTIYIVKFMRRGNIRVGCHEGGYCMELAGPPTQAQLERIVQIMTDAMENGIKTAIGRHRSNCNTSWVHFPDYLRYIRRYTQLDIPYQDLSDELIHELLEMEE